MVADLNKETVDFIETYDGDGKEPTVLPSRIPNLLLNGAVGIAVGMATNIPTHNLTEVVRAIKAVMDDRGNFRTGTDGISARTGLPDRRLSFLAAKAFAKRMKPDAARSRSVRSTASKICPTARSVSSTTKFHTASTR